MRSILNRNEARNRRALSWLKEMETDLNELIQNMKTMKNRVIRLQVELDHMPRIDESTEEDSLDEELTID